MPKGKKADPGFTTEDLAYAYATAANTMEHEEFGGDNAKAQNLAYREVAKRLHRLANHYYRKAAEEEARGGRKA